nr:hypothetical protein [Bacteroidales bacterium]
LRHNEIDFERWDLAVDNALNSIVYAKTFFLNTMSPNWDAVVSENYSVIMPLCWRKKYGIKYLYQPIFSQYHPILYVNNISSETENIILNIVRSIFPYIDININLKKSELIDDWNLKARPTFLLNLNKSYKKLFVDFSNSHKKNLKKSIKNNIEIKIKSEPRFLINTYKTLFNEKGVSGVSKSDLNNLNKIILYFSKNNLGKLYNAYHNNETCASAFFLIYNKRAIIFSVTNAIGKRKGAMFLLIDNFIKEHSQQDIVLDFAGSSIKGVADRNKGFGAQKEIYYHLRENNLPIFFRWLKK